MSPFFINYFPILIIFILSIFLSLIIFFSSVFISFQNPDIEKSSSYECGFDPFDDSRNTFDIKFYLVAILFVIFDLETMFLFPFSLSLSSCNYTGFWVLVDFTFELLIGFIYA